MLGRRGRRASERGGRQHPICPSVRIGGPIRRADDRCDVGRPVVGRGQEPAALADDLADRSCPERGKLEPEVLGDRQREPLDLLGCAGELGPEVRALGGDPGRTGVEVALAGHVAAERDERRRPEPELLGAEQRGDEQIPADLQAAVGPEDDPVSQPVPEERLVDLGETELPGRADVLDRAERAGARPTGVAREVDVVRTGLDDTRPRSSRRPDWRRA